MNGEFFFLSRLAYCLFQNITFHFTFQLSSQLPLWTDQMRGSNFELDLDTADILLKEHMEMFDSIQDRTVQVIQKVSILSKQRRYCSCTSLLTYNDA